MAPKAQKKPVADQKNKKKKSKKSVEPYGIYIFKTLKLLDPNIGIACATIKIINFYVNHILDKLMKEASRLDTIAALRLVLPGRLADDAISESNKAVKKFNENTNCYDYVQLPSCSYNFGFCLRLVLHLFGWCHQS
ncbi:histone H2B.6-like [Bidens hawaiensis]|uniref:histone H2B.6-like n=1 Tax=Bidens hawaiensis TaxID=980011 RepID=UPI00404A2158